MIIFVNLIQVLIIGGGDGGSVREALKHITIEKIVLVEIDEVSKFCSNENRYC